MKSDTVQFKLVIDCVLYLKTGFRLFVITIFIIDASDMKQANLCVVYEVTK